MASQYAEWYCLAQSTFNENINGIWRLMKMSKFSPRHEAKYH